MAVDPKDLAGVIIFILLLLLLAVAAALVANEKPLSLVIDASGLEVAQSGIPVRIPWAHISYVGVLGTFRYSQGTQAGSKTVRNVLVARLGQQAPQPSGATILSANYRELQNLGYVGLCRLADADADPIWLREAIERLSPCPYRTDEELRNLDPRL